MEKGEKKRERRGKNCMQIMLDIVSAYFLACAPRQKLTFSPRSIKSDTKRRNETERGLES